MCSVFYRKYRPESFSEYIGQEHVRAVLDQQLKSGSVSHAYLFTGPRGTGKTTVARLFAKELNSYNNMQEMGASMDVIELDAASNRGIDEIRDLKEKVNFAPSSSKYKIYIIDEVHMLTKEAFNALLKTLEEPPEHIVFLFATTEPHKIPETILSRLMRFDLRLADSDQLSQKVRFILEKEKIEFEEGIIDVIVKYGRGSFRDTESILGKIVESRKGQVIDSELLAKVLEIPDFELVNKFIDVLLNKDISGALGMLEDIYEGGVNLERFMLQTIDMLRDIFKEIITKKQNTKYSYDLRIVSFALKELVEAQVKIKYSLNAQIVFEISCIRICESGGESIVGGNVSNTIKGNKVSKSSKLRGVKNEDKSNKVIKKALDKSVTKNKEKIQKVSKVVQDFDVTEVWKEIVLLVKKENNVLATFLSKSEIGDLSDGKISIYVEFDFHRKKIDSINSKKMIQDAWKSLTGKEVEFFVSVRKNEGKRRQIEKNLNNEVDMVDSNEKIVEDIFEV